MPSFAPNALLKNVSTAYFGSGTFKLMLLTDQYTPNKSHLFRSDATPFEITGTNYIAGGATVSLTVGNVDAALNLVYVTCPGVLWLNSTITARYGFIYKNIGNPATDHFVALIDFGSNKTSTATTFEIGNFRFPVLNTGTLP